MSDQSGSRMPTGVDPMGGGLIFLISQPRSGSTLLQRILGGHAEIHTAAEPWIMLHPLYALKTSGLRAEYDEAWARKALDDFLGRHADGERTYLEAVRAMASVLYGRALAGTGKRLFLDKTPRYYHVIPELQQVFPQARFLFLLRNPLAVLASILDAWVKDDWPLWHYHADLLSAPRLILEGMSLVGAQGLSVRYEDLVSTPETTVGRVCTHLGVSFDPGILEYSQVRTLEGGCGALAGTDHYVRPSPERRDTWRKLAGSPRERAFALTYLEQLGDELLDRLGFPAGELRDALGADRHRSRADPSWQFPHEPGRPTEWLPPSWTGGLPARRPDGGEWPRLSIVTPSLNQARFLERTIRSVIDQGYPNLEYIIIDGGSTDGSVEIIRRYEPWLSYWVSEPDDGQYDAINKGFARSTGSLMAWINADDLYCPWAFQTVVPMFCDAPEVQWITSSTLLVWGEDDSLSQTMLCDGYARTWFYRGRNLGGRSHFAQYVQQEATFWRRGLWATAGGRVEAGLHYAGDFELWARFFRHADLVSTTCPLAGYRRHGRQKTSNMEGYLAEAERVLADYGGLALQRPLAVWLARALFKLTGRGGRFLGSRRVRLSWDVNLSRWVSGWDIVI
jgi:hypothetical protein